MNSPGQVRVRNRRVVAGGVLGEEEQAETVSLKQSRLLRGNTLYLKIRVILINFHYSDVTVVSKAMACLVKTSFGVGRERDSRLHVSCRDMYLSFFQL